MDALMVFQTIYRHASTDTKDWLTRESFLVGYFHYTKAIAIPKSNNLGQGEEADKTM